MTKSVPLYIAPQIAAEYKARRQDGSLRGFPKAGGHVEVSVEVAHLMLSDAIVQAGVKPKSARCRAYKGLQAQIERRFIEIKEARSIATTASMLRAAMTLWRKS